MWLHTHLILELEKRGKVHLWVQDQPSSTKGVMIQSHSKILSPLKNKIQ